MNGPFSWKSHWENLRIVSTNEISASFEQRIGAKLISQNCNLKKRENPTSGWQHPAKAFWRFKLSVLTATALTSMISVLNSITYYLSLT
jgi:anti-sigma-K factor RskA